MAALTPNLPNQRDIYPITGWWASQLITKKKTHVRISTQNDYDGKDKEMHCELFEKIARWGYLAHSDDRCILREINQNEYYLLTNTSFEKGKLHNKIKDLKPNLIIAMMTPEEASEEEPIQIKFSAKYRSTQG